VTTVRQLADLVEARSSTATEYLTFRGLIPAKPAKGYAALFLNGGSRFGDRLAGSINALGWSFRVMCVGYDSNQCLYVAEKFDAKFSGWRPLAANGPWFTQTPDDPPVIRDDSVVEDIRYSLTLRYTIPT
jgi:hypothetical protein